MKREIDKKIEVLDYFKMMDQFKLLQKIILNENQCYMLRKREIKRIIDTEIDIKSFNPKDNNLVELEKDKLNKEKLRYYLISKKADNSLSNVDKLLYSYMENELKSEMKV